MTSPPGANELPSTDVEALKVVNDSGFPLQIAVARAVEATAASHGWKVRYEEHSWFNASDQSKGFIDLVITDRSSCVSVVVECKRVRHASWFFFHPEGQSNSRRHAKIFATKFANDKLSFCDWADMAIDPACPEAMFCAVRGQGVGEKSTMLERIGGELVSATEAFAQQECDFRPRGDSVRLYLSVLVTTAELKVATFAPDQINLDDGTLPEANFLDVPFVRFRKQMSQRRFTLTQSDYNSRARIDYLRENTVFVVRAGALTEFLTNIDIPSASFRSI